MSYTALARKWRPGKFSEVIGQEHVVAALSNSLKNQRIHHAFLFTGTRGVGKTTLARIFAKALNCENGINAEPCCQCQSCISIDQGRFVDLIEVDAASRTKVDDTRELLDNVQYKPTQGRYKVYLIDEVHMLSTHSFNALLKTLEEPPEHVKFLLATTDPKKLPATVLSRCIQFNLKSMDLPLLTSQLKLVCQHEKVQTEDNALAIIAKAANGSVRDALSLLDQAIAFSDSKITQVKVREMLGMIEQHYIEDLLKALATNDAQELFASVGEIAAATVDYLAALDDLLTWLHDISLYQYSPEALSWKALDTEKISAYAPLFSADELQLYYQIGVHGKRDIGNAPDPRTGFEMLLLRMLAFKPADNAQSTIESNESKQVDQSSPPRSKRQRIERGGNSTGHASLQDKQTATRDSAKQTIKTDSNHMPSVSLDNAPAHAMKLRQEAVYSEHADPKPLLAQSAPVASQLETAADAVTNHPVSDFVPSNNMPSSPAALADTMQWVHFVQAAQFNGIIKQIVMNMQPLAYENDCLSLYLDNSCAQLLNADRQTKIADKISQSLNQTVKILVEVRKLDEEAMTPARYQQKMSAKKMADAKDMFMQDENVQELINLFDAQVDESSIRPGESS